MPDEPQELLHELLDKRRAAQGANVSNDLDVCADLVQSLMIKVRDEIASALARHFNGAHTPAPPPAPSGTKPDKTAKPAKAVLPKKGKKSEKKGGK